MLFRSVVPAAMIFSFACSGGEDPLNFPDASTAIDSGARASVCGDGVLDEDELCEGYEVGDARCTDFGFHFGAVTCTSTCTFDHSACFSRCGDGVLDSVEDCEPNIPLHIDCEALSRRPGVLSCSETCTFDTTACGGVCGDGVLDESEACDGAIVPTCESMGFVRGTAGCDATCAVDTSGCAPLRLADEAEVNVVGFTPDGTQVLYSAVSAGGEVRLYLGAVDGSTRILVARGIDRRDFAFVFSPDGSKLFYSSQLAPELNAYATRLFDFNTGIDREVHAGVLSIFGPIGVFSGDGAHLVFSTRLNGSTASLNVFDLDSGVIHQVSQTVPMTSEGAPFAFSPDHKQMFYIADFDFRLFSKRGELRIWDFDTMQSTLLEADVIWQDGAPLGTPPQVFDGSRAITLSADGGTLTYFHDCELLYGAMVDRDLEDGTIDEIASRVYVFVSRLSPDAAHALLVYGPSVSLLDRVTSQSFVLPDGSGLINGSVILGTDFAFSPDSRSLAYIGAKTDLDPAGHLYLSELSTSTTTILLREAPATYFDGLRFTADSRYVLVERQHDPDFDREAVDLFLVPVSDPAATATVALDVSRSLVWIAPQTARIATEDRGTGALRIFETASGTSRALTANFASVKQTPNGRFLVYLVRDSLFAFDLDQGGDPVSISEDVTSFGTTDVHVAYANEHGAFVYELPR